MFSLDFGVLFLKCSVSVKHCQNNESYLLDVYQLSLTNEAEGEMSGLLTVA